VLELAVAQKKPSSSAPPATTAEEKAQLLALAAQVPCVWAGNFSVGVNLLFALTRRAARMLGSDYDAEVVEMHHRFKRTRPAAPPRASSRSSSRNASSPPARCATVARASLANASPTEVGVHSLRGGDVVGEHTVMFAALGERLELTHKASDRGIFARGRPAGRRLGGLAAARLYDMQDVLGLKA
jgi:4-hydroxy-tetrahydrodipicolinate reductase